MGVEMYSLPKNKYALTNKGNALYSLGNFTGAIKYYDKVLDIDPKHVIALDNKGLALQSLGNFTGAIKYYDKVLDIDPKNVIALKGKHFIECCIKVPRTIKV
jgi:tetratricopeptide (TPR) repeat protein